MLISIDGLDGAGKSLQAELLRQRLSALGFAPVLYREPGGTWLGEQLRELLLHRQCALFLYSVKAKALA